MFKPHAAFHVTFRENSKLHGEIEVRWNDGSSERSTVFPCKPAHQIGILFMGYRTKKIEFKNPEKYVLDPGDFERGEEIKELL